MTGLPPVKTIIVRKSTFVFARFDLGATDHDIVDANASNGTGSRIAREEHTPDVGQSGIRESTDHHVVKGDRKVCTELLQYQVVVLTCYYL